jgi:hypothetical protein
MNETPKMQNSSSSFRKSGDYTVRVTPTPSLPTRRSDITGVTLAKIARPKTTMERIEAMEEKTTEYKKV